MRTTLFFHLYFFGHTLVWIIQFGVVLILVWRVLTNSGFGMQPGRVPGSRNPPEEKTCRKTRERVLSRIWQTEPGTPYFFFPCVLPARSPRIVLNFKAIQHRALRLRPEALDEETAHAIQSDASSILQRAREIQTYAQRCMEVAEVPGCHVFICFWYVCFPLSLSLYLSRSILSSLMYNIYKSSYHIMSYHIYLSI